MIRCHPKVSWEHSVKGSRNSRPVRSHCLPCLPRTLCLTAGQSVHNNWRIADARPRTLGSISMYLQHLLPPDTLPTVVEACSAFMQTVKQGFGAFLVLSDCDWRFSVFVPTHHCAASQVLYSRTRGRPTAYRTIPLESSDLAACLPLTMPAQGCSKYP